MFVVQEQAAPRPIPVWQGHSALPGHQAGHGAAGTDRFAERQEDLAPEDVEEVGWSGAVHDDPVALIELTHIKVIQLLSWPARVRGFHETHGTSWPRGSSSRERSGPQPSLLPSLPFLPSLFLPFPPSPEHTETGGDLGEAPGLCPPPWSGHGGGQQPPLMPLSGPRLPETMPQPQVRWRCSRGTRCRPFLRTLLAHEPKASHASCHRLPLC